MIRRPPRSTQSRSSAASDVYKRQILHADELTYSVTAPEDNKILSGSVIESYQRLSKACLLYTSPSPRDRTRSRMPSSA